MICLMQIYNVTMANLSTRRQEIYLFRVAGMTRGQLQRMIFFGKWDQLSGRHFGGYRLWLHGKSLCHHADHGTGWWSGIKIRWCTLCMANW